MGHGRGGLGAAHVEDALLEQAQTDGGGSVGGQGEEGGGGQEPGQEGAHGGKIGQAIQPHAGQEGDGQGVDESQTSVGQQAQAGQVVEGVDQGQGQGHPQAEQADPGPKRGVGVAGLGVVMAAAPAVGQDGEGQKQGQDAHIEGLLQAVAEGVPIAAVLGGSPETGQQGGDQGGPFLPVAQEPGQPWAAPGPSAQDLRAGQKVDEGEELDPGQGRAAQPDQQASRGPASPGKFADHGFSFHPKVAKDAKVFFF